MVFGLQVEPGKVIPGDLYICCTTSNAEEVPGMLGKAVENGASALLLPHESRDMEAITGAIPEGMPVHYVLNVAEVAQRLAVAFYG